jgi:hypothetical protein
MERIGRLSVSIRCSRDLTRTGVDVDLDTGVNTIEQQRIANGHLVTIGPPKTATSRRLIAPAGMRCASTSGAFICREQCTRSRTWNGEKAVFSSPAHSRHQRGVSVHCWLARIGDCGQVRCAALQRRNLHGLDHRSPI